jgi:hypothetical protein
MRSLRLLHLNSHVNLCRLDGCSCCYAWNVGQKHIPCLQKLQVNFKKLTFRAIFMYASFNLKTEKQFLRSLKFIRSFPTALP